MKISQLFEKIKKDLEKYQDMMKKEPADFKLDEHSCEFRDIPKTMSRYNLDNFQEIMKSSSDDYAGEVDVEDLKDMEVKIDHYFQLHGSGDDEFKEFIKGISIYLTFISCKPLHPSGIIFSNKTTVYENEGIYYCTGKKIFIKDELSLCKYCICQSSPVNTPPKP